MQKCFELTAKIVDLENTSNPIIFCLSINCLIFTE
jgi:hypothetical protein